MTIWVTNGPRMILEKSLALFNFFDNVYYRYVVGADDPAL